MLSLLSFLALPLGIVVYGFPNKLLGSAAYLGLIAIELGCAACLLSVFIRRLHDRGKSGWWLLFFFGPHILLLTILSQIGDTNVQMILGATGALLDAPLVMWGMVEILLLRSKSGPNAYGPVPTYPREDTSAQF